MSKLLAGGGWKVHLILCGDVEDGPDPPDPLAELAGEGVSCHLLESLPAPAGAGTPHYGGDHPTVILGEHALEGLEALHAEHRFDLIEFPDLGALGLRAVQAKAAGDALLDVQIAVKLHGPSRRRRESNLELRTTPRDLKLEFCERYAFERADLQLSASHHMLDYVREAEWAVRDDASVVDLLSETELDLVYGALLSRSRQPRSARASQPTTVTLAVAHYNHDRFLPGALASLAAQTRPPEEVIVIDDGSSSEEARRVFAEQEERYPDWTFLRQENAGPGVARNRALERAEGAYFLPFDSDNIAKPRLVERLLEAMVRNPSRAATTCHNLGFVEDADIEAADFAFRYSPTGGPRISACLENVYGDTCALFRTESLRRVGGFEAARWSPYEDWETFAKMTLGGLEVEVLPQPLFYYRTAAGGRLRTLGEDGATALRLRARLIDFFTDAELSSRERRDLLECLQAFDRFVAEGVSERLAELRRWHDSQMADLHAFRRAQLEELRARLGAEIEVQRSRAEAAEGELAALSAITPRRLLRRAVRAARSRVLRSSRPVR
jgi:glycosyltransferase involved in cell wall biosynthesis